MTQLVSTHQKNTTNYLNISFFFKIRQVDILDKAQHDDLKQLVNVKTAKSDTHERVSFYLTDSHPARDGGGRAQCVVRVYSFIISSKGELLP